MKKLIHVFGGIPEALAEGTMTFPIYVFTALFYQHYGEIDFIMPFVLWYTFQRAGVFFISCFGIVKNPYKLCFFELLTAAIGCLWLIFGANYALCWNIGAILIGFGISGYSAMFRTSRDEMQDARLVDFKGSTTMGYVFYLLALVVVLIFGANNISVSIFCLSVLVIGALVFVALMWKKNPYGDVKVFEKTETRKGFLLDALSVFAFTFFVRFYRMTANIWVIELLTIVLVVLLFIGNRYNTRTYHAQSMRTLWYGATMNFLYVFSLLYFTSVGEPSKLNAAYFMIGLGTTVAMVAALLFKKVIPSKQYESFCVIATIVMSGLMLIPNMYMLGTVLTAMFLSMGSSESFKKYMDDDRFIKEERRLVHLKYNGLGSVIEQTQILIVIFIFSALINKNFTAAIAGYAFRKGSTMNEPVYRWSLFVCIILNAVAGIILIRLNEDCMGRRKKE